LLDPAITRPGVPAHWRRLSGDEDLPRELLSVELHWPSNLKRSIVIMGGGGFCITGEFEAPLRELLAGKAQKHDSYLRRCDRCWLAVVLPHYFEAEDEGVRSPALGGVYDSPFERIIIVDAQVRRFWFLQVRIGVAP